MSAENISDLEQYNMAHDKLRSLNSNKSKHIDIFIHSIMSATKMITRNRRRALRQNRQLQHLVSSVGDVFSTAAASEVRTIDRRVSHGAEAAASWLSPVGSRRSSTDGPPYVRGTPREESMLGNRRSCMSRVIMTVSP